MALLASLKGTDAAFSDWWNWMQEQTSELTFVATKYLSLLLTYFILFFIDVFVWFQLESQLAAADQRKLDADASFKFQLEKLEENSKIDRDKKVSSLSL